MIWWNTHSSKNRRRSMSPSRPRGKFFCDDLLKDVPVQAQIRHQALQLRVLIAQLPQLAQLLQSQPRILLLPQVKRLLADPMLAADLDYRVPRLRLPQHPQNLLFAVSSLRHLQALLSCPENHAWLRSLNFTAA